MINQHIWNVSIFEVLQAIESLALQDCEAIQPIDKEIYCCQASSYWLHNDVSKRLSF